MADLTITAANVVAGTGAVIEHGTAGATVTAGQWVYLDEDGDGRLKLADTDSATADVRRPRGMALHGASNGQPLAIVKSGPVTIGAVLTAAVAYYLSGTPGGMCPVADVAAGDYVCVLGMAQSASVFLIDIQFPNVALA